MIGHYCALPDSSVKVNDTLKIGWPWIDGSSCDHVLLSLPYTLGRSFEWMDEVVGNPVRFLWALPITEKEAEFAFKNGVESLERLFESEKINPLDPYRKSVVV